MQDKEIVAEIVNYSRKIDMVEILVLHRGFVQATKFRYVADELNLFYKE